MARNRRQNRGGHRGRDEHRETGHQNQGSRHQQQQQQQQQQGPSPLQQQTGQQLVGLLTQLIGQQVISHLFLSLAFPKTRLVSFPIINIQ